MGSWGSGVAEDNSVGPIVWVRRRNGSWWPGKIMEAQELQECNLSSPRTGTPVKLLGREDASVDWYNLEKSKRVKSFRCGDFDNCIERAESAQGMPIKKREKYARREDAILHALELEKQLGLQVRKSSDRIRSKSTGSTKRELGTFSENLGNNNRNPGNAKSDQFLSEAGTDMRDDLGEDLNTINGTQPIWEDDHHEATPRMRGLQDLGLKTTPLKRKLSSSFDLDGSGKHIADDYSQDFPNGASSMQRTTHENGAEQRPPMYRAKRSRFVYLPPEYSDSMDDEELYSSKPRVSPSQFGDNDFHPRSLSLNEENSSSEFVDNDESDSSETSSAESETDSSETEPDIDKEMVVYSDAAVHTDTEQDIPRLGHPEAPLEHGSTSTEGSEGSAFSGDTSLLYPGDPFLANEAVSKWQLKGKRNIRHLTKNYADTDYVRDSDHQRFKGSSRGQRAYSVVNVNRKYAGTKMVGLNYASYPYASRFSSRGRNGVSHDEMDWDDMAWENRFVYGGYWEDGAENFNPTYIGRRHFGGRMESMLVDVDLKVQANYQKKDVPIMSLTSKLNGMAIIGHPIQIEALEDGSSEPLIHTNDYYDNGIADHDGTTRLPVWRTARRTKLRVPRPDLSSVLGSYAATGDITSTDHERRPPFKKSGAGNFGHKASSARKSLSHIPRPPADRKKLVKKVSSPSNRKTRTLSSITKPLHDASDSKMGGILKPETSRPTTVACIPVKLVFSRLLEKINRPPSKATTNVVLSNRNADRQTTS